MGTTHSSKSMNKNPKSAEFEATPSEARHLVWSVSTSRILSLWSDFYVRRNKHEEGHFVHSWLHGAYDSHAMPVSTSPLQPTKE